MASSVSEWPERFPSVFVASVSGGEMQWLGSTSWALVCQRPGGLSFCGRSRRVVPEAWFSGPGSGANSLSGGRSRRSAVSGPHRFQPKPYLHLMHVTALEQAEVRSSGAQCACVYRVFPMASAYPPESGLDRAVAESLFLNPWCGSGTSSVLARNKDRNAFGRLSGFSGRSSQGLGPTSALALRLCLSAGGSTRTPHGAGSDRQLYWKRDSSRAHGERPAGRALY